MGEIGEHYRDYRQHKKRVKQEQLQRQAKRQKSVEADTDNEKPLPRRRCYDWVVSTSGSFHWARNRSSFHTYRRIRATAQGMPVIGIGTVLLDVRSSSTAMNQKTLELHNVIHIPKALCNGFCTMKSLQQRSSMSFDQAGIYSKNASGAPIWFAKPFKGLWKLALVGDPQGETFLDDGPKIMSIYLSPEEEETLKAFVED